MKLPIPALGIPLFGALLVSSVVSASELSSLSETAPGNQEEMKSDAQASQSDKQDISVAEPGTGSAAGESQSDRSAGAGGDQPPAADDQPATRD